MIIKSIVLYFPKWIYIFLGLSKDSLSFMPRLCKSEAPPALTRSVLHETALNFSGQLPPFYFA